LAERGGRAPLWPGLAARLEGERVLLEPLEPRHEDEMREAASDPEIWTLTRDDRSQPDRFSRWFERALADDEVAFATIDRASGRIVGSTRFMSLRPHDRGLEIGHTWLVPAHWRRGTNVESKLLMLTHAFERAGCARVEFKTDERNWRSRRALEALGATFEGVFRKHVLLPDGSWRDSAYYSVVEDEWPAVKSSLQRRLAPSARRPGGSGLD
jgi:RimJ/RimL family protein N-acetyltransferase